MTAIKLTNQQIRYMLELNIDEEKNTITGMSSIFGCSKANSKYILDRMVKLGVLYRDENLYKLTVLGKLIAKDLSKERDNIIESLDVIFSLNKEKTLDLANNLMDHEQADLRKELLAIKENARHHYEIGQDISNKELQKLISYDKYKISNLIVKSKKSDNISTIQASMAQKGFSRKAIVHNTDKPYIELNTSQITKSLGGYKKRGSAIKLLYKIGDNQEEAIIKDGKIILPLDIVSTWWFVSKTSLISGTWLYINSLIGFNQHNTEALFLFLIDLIDLKI